MKLWSKRLILAVTGITAGWIIGAAFSGRAAAQGPAPAKQVAGTFFKNVTTDALKGLTPDDFLGAMGVMADSLGFDCSDCHPGAGTDNVDWVIDTPKKKMARKMVDMVQVINRTNFAGTQLVTCFTCHHGRDVPSTTIALDSLYSTPNMEKDDIIRADKDQPAATEVLDRYIQALGGAQKVDSLTSYIATGASLGYEGLGGNGQFTIFAKAPDQRTTLIHFPNHPERADSEWTYDGKVAWVTTPRGLLGKYQLAGNELDGAKLEATLSFPGKIKQSLTNWRTGALESIGDNDYTVIEGMGPRGLMAKLYFDTKTNLLARIIRFTPSPIGRIPVQVDYSDYREVDGIKFPFELNFLWLDGRYTAKISDVKINVPIDEARFAKP